MITCNEKIEKNTVNGSEFNSSRVTEEMVGMNQKIYEYTSKTLFGYCDPGEWVKVSQNMLGRPQINEIKIPYADGAWVSLYPSNAVCCISPETQLDSNVICAYTVGAFYSPEVEIRSNIETISEMFRASKELLNIEEEPAVFRPAIFDDYSIDGVSIYSEEAVAFQMRMQELKNKHGIAK
jgi:hypothetical protein